MTDELPAQWALDKAAKECGYDDWSRLRQYNEPTFRVYMLAIALARYIEKHEPAPVDPDLELAREICARVVAEAGLEITAAGYRAGHHEYEGCAIWFVRDKIKERGK